MEKKTKYDRPELSHGWQMETWDDAEEFLTVWGDRINLVLKWLKSHGCPEPDIQIGELPNPFGGARFNHHLIFESEEKRYVSALVLAIYNPAVTLASLAREWPDLVKFEYWKEPERPPAPAPVKRPFDFENPDVVNPAPGAYLSNRFDKFQTGAVWTEPDGRVYMKEKCRRSFWGWITYYRWRLIASVPDA